MTYPFPFPPGRGMPAPPPGPPPGRIPTRSMYRRVPPGSFRPCLYRYTYVWLRNGRQFWFYPVFLESGGVAGYRWNGATWRFYGLDFRRVDYFECF